MIILGCITLLSRFANYNGHTFLYIVIFRYWMNENFGAEKIKVHETIRVTTDLFVHSNIIVGSMEG